MQDNSLIGGWDFLGIAVSLALGVLSEWGDAAQFTGPDRVKDMLNDTLSEQCAAGSRLPETGLSIRTGDALSVYLPCTRTTIRKDPSKVKSLSAVPGLAGLTLRTGFLRSKSIFAHPRASGEAKGLSFKLTLRSGSGASEY